MKIKVFSVLSVSLMVMGSLQAQVTGLWKSTDHKDNIEKSVVLIYEKNGKLYGKVERLLPTATITHCTGCEGELKNKSIVGMLIITDLIKNQTGGTDGKILDPTNGKFYSCDIELVTPDQLKVRGYIGFPTFGKTMYWNRLKNQE